MRKLIFMFILALFIINVNGQGIKFSIHADPQFSWFSSDENNITPNGAVYHVNTGIEMNYFFQENYAFSFGLDVNNMGGNLIYSDSTILTSKGDPITIEPETNLKHRVQYISLPLGLKLKTEELGYLTFSFHGGFMPMIKINSNISTENNVYDRKDIMESTNLFNLNYFVGANVEYRLGGKTTVIGGLRWSSGFTDITKDDKANITLNTLSLLVGIQF